MSTGTLTIAGRNYGSWSLRGWLLCRFAGLEVEVVSRPVGEASTRAELLLLSPSFLVPRLEHGDVTVWDTLAIAEYLHEAFPAAGLLPGDVAERAHCRAIAGEMHAGFANLRAALPMNLKAFHPGFRVVASARADIDRIESIWADCLARYGGPYLFGAAPSMADAMYAPVCTRLGTYDIAVEHVTAAYCDVILALEPMREWIDAARAEPDEVPELEMEF